MEPLGGAYGIQELITLSRELSFLWGKVEGIAAPMWVEERFGRTIYQLKRQADQVDMDLTKIRSDGPDPHTMT